MKRTGSASRSAIGCVPGENCPDVRATRRGGDAAGRFHRAPTLGHALRPDERYPAGDYPNQHPDGDGLPTLDRGRPAVVDDATLVVVVRLWPQPRAAAGGLARDAGLVARIHAEAGRVLFAEPGAGSAAGKLKWPGNWTVSALFVATRQPGASRAASDALRGQHGRSVKAQAGSRFQA